jgi:hypothetical protein
VSKFVDDIISNPLLEDTTKGYIKSNVHMLLYFRLLRSDYLSDYALQIFNSGIFAQTAEPGVSQHNTQVGRRCLNRIKRRYCAKLRKQEVPRIFD